MSSGSQKPQTAKVSKITSSLGVKMSASANNIQKAFVPPVLHEVSKLAAGVASVNAGSASATGNPRNKCSLQPGHSLMDWIRLGSSGIDLTGVGSKAGHLTITPKELAEHNKEADVWLAIRGKVFNVTRYLPFHPGGPQELMKGAGRDATELFEQVHPWVNYESILQKCYLGRLSKLDPNAEIDSFFNEIPIAKKSPPRYNQISPNNETVKLKAEEPFSPPKSPAEFKEPVQLPRFDWIQKTDYITIIFYTKAFSNPQVEITKPSLENVLSVLLSYEHQTYANEIKFSKAIQWPCHTKINYETGKVEIVFKKVDGQIWENYGVLMQRSEDAKIADVRHKYSVVSKVPVNYNTCLIELQRADGTKFTIPIGKHIRVFAKVKGEEISRSYTPVPGCLFSTYKPQNYTTDNVCLMVKSYPSGNISKYICSKNKDDTLELSKPLGTFNLRDLESREMFLMLAAGTGITPMLTLLLFLLERRSRKCQRVVLIFFNKAEEDILFRNQLDALQKDDSRFLVQYVLSEPNAKWNGTSGRIKFDILNEAISKHIKDTIYTKKDIFFTICGPTPFTNLTQTLLKELEIANEQMHLFIG